jgi:carbamoyl-phosphate synthase large subunit
MKEINILFIGGAKRVSLGERFIKAGARRNCKINIYSYELAKEVPIAELATVIVGLKWKDSELYNHLKSVVINLKIDTIIPFVDPAIEVTSKLAELFPNLYIPISKEEINRIMFDKILANEWFLENKFPVPLKGDEFPLIAKPSKGSASRGIIILNDLCDIDYFNSKNQKEDFLLQKFIFGTEYTSDCYISKSGKIISVVPRKRLEVTSGEATKTITVRDTEIIEMSKEILIRGSFLGPITIQFIRDNITSITYIMEINPRFGGGVLASIEAGADSTQVLIDELLSLPIAENNEWKENLIMTRSFRETYFYANNN